MGCITLLSLSWFAFEQRVSIWGSVSAWLRFVFSVPPGARQPSTWPGEFEWELDEADEEAEPRDELTGSDPFSQAGH